MKLDALDHPKTYEFAAQLECGMATAIGHLELFWAFVAKKAPQGHVGKWPNGAIARSCLYDGCPDKFVDALVASGYVDVSDGHRLVVHDWHEHMPRWVKAKLKKAGIEYSSADYSGDCSADCSSDSSGDSVREGKGREGKGSEVKGREEIYNPPEKTISILLKEGHLDLPRHLGHFLDYAEKRYEQGKPYADHDRAFRRAVRDNWARVFPPRAASDHIETSEY